MKIKVKNCAHPACAEDGNYALKVWLSPDGRYASASLDLQADLRIDFPTDLVSITAAGGAIARQVQEQLQQEYPGVSVQTDHAYEQYQIRAEVPNPGYEGTVVFT